MPVSNFVFEEFCFSDMWVSERVGVVHTAALAYFFLAGEFRVEVEEAVVAAYCRSREAKESIGRGIHATRES